jgi:hypothetical protein
VQRTDPKVGIRKYRHGWQAYIRVEGRLVSRTFPRTATREEMQAWRRSQRPENLSTAADTDPHQLPDPLKVKLKKILDEAIHDQARNRIPIRQGFHARLYPTTEPS